MRRDGAAAAIAAGDAGAMLSAMTSRTRKLAGSFALVLFVTVYMALAMEVTAILLGDKPDLIKGLGYAFAGLIWIIPAGAIISWMAKPDR